MRRAGFSLSFWERHPVPERSRACAGVVMFALSLVLNGADIEEARKLYLSGDYTRCAELAQGVVAERPFVEDWQILLADSLLAVGRYPEARTAVTNALARGYPQIRLRWHAREALLSNGQTAEAADQVDQILQMASESRNGFRDGRALVVVGRAALLKGAEPRRVLDRLFNVARKADPLAREPYLASGELALEKHDFALAAKTFQEGLEKIPDDPDLLCGLARAYAPNQPALALESLEAALKRNSRHVPSRLLLVDHAIDAEDYAGAKEQLDKVEAVNPWHPDAWTYRAVLASLENQPEAERRARENALRFWPTNPRVDHLLGLKLSQKYRFAEGAVHQRQALEFDPDYLPARAQLAQDLLRLGEETEGWQLAEEVQKKDAYDVTANNLLALHDTMSKFRILTNAHFVVRMTPHEAALYGPRVLELLEQARERLGTKYGLEPTAPTLVEVFADQKDFAVRTFGMPQNDGYLGVCFGRVVTANSPGSHPGHAFNWEAMLWHEFCHVVTLQLTRNKMPRWLSEGISVYEERQANPAWGEHLKPRYRELMLGDELTPVSHLSAAFLNPRSEIHLQFAYYESSLVVQFLVERFGLDALKAVLHDLGEGVEMNQALERHTAPLPQIEKDFAAFAGETARNLAPGLDWAKPDLKTRKAEGASSAAATPLVVRSNNFYVLVQQAHTLAEEKNWLDAKPILERLVEWYPDFTGPESAYRTLAQAHRALGETREERQVLSTFAERDPAAPDAYLRLTELARAAQDWPTVALNARRYLAVNPLVPSPYRALADAADKTGDARAAIESYRALLELDPPDPAETHFRLAQWLYRAGDPGARRQVLQALEEAPRYPAALQLLVKLNEAAPPASTTATPEPKP